MTADGLRHHETIEEIEAEHEVRTQNLLSTDPTITPMVASIRAITLMLREARQQSYGQLRLCG